MPRKASPTYTDLQLEISKLQAKAEELRKSEVSQVIAQIRTAIQHYRLTSADLGLSNGSKSSDPDSKPVARKAPNKVKKFTVPVRYRDDKGNTWTGRGNKPRWLMAALADGKQQDDFRIN